MKEVKHTPGPWAFQKPDGVSIRHPKVYSDFGDIGNASWVGDLSQTEANARLIAAAPELLDALQDYVDFRSNVKDVPGSILEKARAAIAKATGEKNE